MDCMRLWGDGRQSGYEFDFPKLEERAVVQLGVRGSY